mgnify:CR=1 FL=1
MIVRAGRAVVAAGLAALGLLPGQGGAAALVLGVQLEPPVLDPTVNPAAAIGEILDGNLYEGLVRFDARGEVLPALASRWDISRDGLTWVFHLREGVRFHDGKVFDAGAAKFSLDRARAPDSANPQRSRLEAIRDVEATDAHTLTLHLSRRSGNLLQSLAFTAFAMLSPTSPDNAAHPAGTAPFLYYVDPDIPHNQGVIDCISVTAPKGSICNPNYPASTSCADRARKNLAFRSEKRTNPIPLASLGAHL